ncbi:hypothetical protein DNTS_017648, partial [Danionella cerebrum]
MRCMCQDGSVTCSGIVACPQVTCLNPVTTPGECCPRCSVCVQHGQNYQEGQSLTLTEDPCLKCTCVGGEVKCVAPRCEKLSCRNQITGSGSCCPRCRGCVYDGVERQEGSTWLASGSHCMSCLCMDGVTTCSELQCVSTCLNQISVPGECCP